MLPEEEIRQIEERLKVLNTDLDLPKSLSAEELHKRLTAEDCRNFREAGHPDFMYWQRYAGMVASFIVVLITLVVTQNLIRSKHGRAITAIRDNEIAAKAMGINVTYYKLFVFVFAAFFAGVAGVLYGHQTTPVMYSFFSYNYSIEILVMVVLGGMGNITGSILAATLITYVNFVLQNELTGNLAALKLLIYAIILVVVVLFNNAPVFRAIKEKLNFRRLFERKHSPEKIKDDDAAWDRVPTKIQMDELLSVDITPTNYEPDKGLKDRRDN